MISRTLYTGAESEEKATKSYNYNVAGDTVKSTTTYTYRTDDSLEVTDTTRGQDTTDMISRTLYTGAESEEKAIKSYNYNYAGSVKSTTNKT